jgi:hypothetical protein
MHRNCLHHAGVRQMAGTMTVPERCRPAVKTVPGRTIMGRGILLWLLGVPIPVIILLALIWH